MHTETQTLLQGLNAARARKEELAAVLQGFSPGLSRIGDQLSQLAGFAQDAELAETSLLVRSALSELPHQLDAAGRSVAELRKQIRTLAQLLRSIGERAELILEKARQEGYDP